jgi:putative membrane protein
MKLAIIATFTLPLTSFAAPSPGALNDAQIARVLVTINQGEIEAAKIAESRAQSESAKKFATMMIQDHTQNLAESKNLARKDNFGMAKSSLATSLENDAKRSNAQIKKSAKQDFDQAYMKEQVAMHQKALDTLKNTLIPNAQNADLKKLLEDTTKHVESHLELAKTSSENPGSNTN